MDFLITPVGQFFLGTKISNMVNASKTTKTTGWRRRGFLAIWGLAAAVTKANPGLQDTELKMPVMRISLSKAHVHVHGGSGKALEISPVLLQSSPTPIPFRTSVVSVRSLPTWIFFSFLSISFFFFFFFLFKKKKKEFKPSYTVRVTSASKYSCFK